jgi:cell division protein FtsZ
MLVKPQAALNAKIKVIGVGGGGGNALNTMITEYNVQDVEFIAVNTDAQALVNSKADVKLRIGEQITRGLGSGGNPVIGRKAAEESVDQIHEHLAGSDMVFITAGMGGGTGTGAAPIVAGIAKNLGALTVGVVTKPFHFEMKKRMDSALKGIEELRDKVDTLIVVPNQRLLESLDKNVSFLDAMQKADDVLAQAVKSIANLITQTGLINVDFADVKSVMADGGTALMGIGSASGDNRATEAARMAIESPLLEVSIDGAKGVLFNVIGGKDLGMLEISSAAEVIKEKINPDATFIFGASIDPSYEDKLEVTVLATGFDMDYNTGEFTVMARPGTDSLDLSKSVGLTKKPEIKSNVMGNFQKPVTPTPTEEEDLESLPSFLRRRKED